VIPSRPALPGAPGALCAWWREGRQAMHMLHLPERRCARLFTTATGAQPATRHAMHGRVVLCNRSQGKGRHPVHSLRHGMRCTRASLTVCATRHPVHSGLIRGIRHTRSRGSCDRSARQAVHARHGKRCTTSRQAGHWQRQAVHDKHGKRCTTSTASGAHALRRNYVKSTTCEAFLKR
jgi:hypothetical protein